LNDGDIDNQFERLYKEVAWPQGYSTFLAFYWERLRRIMKMVNIIGL